jgi:diketogulonate reductase-like aldo/keto reductase
MPGTPFEDSLGTLAELQRAGKIEHLGLCNVDVPEILQAQRHFAVTAIQNELSVSNRKAAAGGTLELARRIGAVFMAHRPLAGHAKTDTLEKNRAMAPIATRHGCSRHEAALATLLDAGPPLLPVVGSDPDRAHRLLAQGARRAAGRQRPRRPRRQDQPETRRRRRGAAGARAQRARACARSNPAPGRARSPRW